jgi:putrescine transport system ATP-binding protein
VTQVTLSHVGKRFGSHRAVDNVDLTIEAGAFFVLLGGSGCGKTTLLRMLAGFVEPDEGAITIDGADMAGLPPHRRPVNMMFQSYALFPHMSVADNVAFGLRREGVAKRETAERTHAALATLRLEDFAARKPDSLSGGQRQRVALARALVKRPRVLLLDEPLSALDRQLREDTGLELARLQRTLGTTFVMVTHDQQEAMALATRIAIMRSGRIVQVGSPADLYERPADRFVAGFLGTINLFEGAITGEADGAIALDCPAAGTTLTARAVACPAGAAIGIRPERIAVGPPGRGRLDARVVSVAYLGSRHLAVLALPGGMTVRADLAAPPPGDLVGVDWPDDAAMILP